MQIMGNTSLPPLMEVFVKLLHVTSSTIDYGGSVLEKQFALATTQTRFHSNHRGNVKGCVVVDMVNLDPNVHDVIVSVTLGRLVTTFMVAHLTRSIQLKLLLTIQRSSILFVREL